MKLPQISGGLGAPKPWQIITGILVMVLFIFLAPALSSLMSAKKKQNATVLAEVGKQGVPYQPAAFPVPPRVLTPPAATPPVIQPTPPPAVPLAASAPATALAATKPGKTVDPEQEAIDAPILISSGATGNNAPPASQPVPHGGMSAQLERGAAAADGGLGGLLKPTELTGYRASVMAHPGLTIEQGRILQCHNVSRMTSGLPGFVRAQLTYDVWSADGTMKLLDHDSMIFGEITHGLTNGQDRLFVLWHQITTPAPNLVRITLNSPAADEMGEAGVAGDVDRHFWQKVKGALLLSGIDTLFSGASGALSNLGRGNGNNSQSQGLNLNFSQTGSQGTNLASQMLQSTIQIPDTMTVNQASACSIFVSGDLDFSGVYSATRRTIQ